MATAIQFPAVLFDGNASDEDVAVPASLLVCWTRVIATGCGMGLPVPLRLTVCGLPLALSRIVRVPVALPLTTGWNVTLIVQFAAAAKVVGQLFVCANGCPALVL